MTPPKSVSAPAAPDPCLSVEQQAQLALLDYDLPDYKTLSNGECGALGAEALEGYFYGDRVRYDTGGKKWHFLREPKGNGFFLTITVSCGPLVLESVSVPLDRIASKEGEESILALVERLAVDTVATAKLARAEQQAQQKAATPEGG